MKKGILFALAATVANAFPASANDELHGISPTLLRALNTWLDAETEFGRRNSQPQIKLIEKNVVEQLDGAPDRLNGRTRGLYDDETETIYLVEPWSASNQRDISILLHEIVHHRQSGQFWYCEQAQEWRAFQIQAQWLHEQQIKDDFYWPAILLQSSCVKRDIHPE